MPVLAILSYFDITRSFYYNAKHYPESHKKEYLVSAGILKK